MEIDNGLESIIKLEPERFQSVENENGIMLSQWPLVEVYE